MAIPVMDVDAGRVIAHLREQIAELSVDRAMLLARIDLLDGELLDRNMQIATFKAQQEANKECQVAAPKAPAKSAPSRKATPTGGGSEASPT
jgi:hypothetical protein